MTRNERINAAIEAAIARDPTAGLQPCPRVCQLKGKKLFERRTPRFKIANAFKAGSGVLS